MRQITKEKESNWNIFQDEKGAFWSMAKNEECKNSFFCKDIKYIIGLIYKYKSYKKEDFTKYGYNLILNYLKDHKFTEDQLFN